MSILLFFEHNFLCFSSRIQHKPNSIHNIVHLENAKHTRKRTSPKRNDKEKMTRRVEETIENPFHINGMDQKSSMEYFRRTLLYVLFTFLPMTQKTICILPLPLTFSLCNEEDNDNLVTSIKDSKQIPIKKLRTKKERRAKQFIHSHITKLGVIDDKATERRVDETMKKLYSKPSLPPLQTPLLIDNIMKIHKKQNKYLSKRLNVNQRKIPFNKEYSMKNKIRIKLKTNENKKQFQFMGEEMKVKYRNRPIITTSPTIQISLTTSSTPILKSISEVIQEEAAVLLAEKYTSSLTWTDINEVNEILQERPKLQTTRSTILIGSPISNDNHTGLREENTKENTLDLENVNDSF